MGKPASPYPRPREGLGARSPPEKNLIFIPSLRGAAVWTALARAGGLRIQRLSNSAPCRMICVSRNAIAVPRKVEPFWGKACFKRT